MGYSKGKNIGFLQVPLLEIKAKTRPTIMELISIYGLNMHRKEVKIKKFLNSKRDLIEIVGPTGGFFVKKDVWIDVGVFDESQKFHINKVMPFI